MAKRKRWEGISLGIFWSVVGMLITLVVAFWIAWMASERETWKLILELNQHKEYAEDLKKALDERSAGKLDEGMRQEDEYPVQFYVTDESGRPFIGVTAVVVESGEEVVTSKAGLTPTIWIRLGEKVSLRKEGFRSEKIVLGRDLVEKRVIRISLRR